MLRTRYVGRKSKGVFFSRGGPDKRAVYSSPHLRDQDTGRQSVRTVADVSGGPKVAGSFHRRGSTTCASIFEAMKGWGCMDGPRKSEGGGVSLDGGKSVSENEG